jgi:hypothetical protein
MGDDVGETRELAIERRRKTKIRRPAGDHPAPETIGDFRFDPRPIEGDICIPQNTPFGLVRSLERPDGRVARYRLHRPLNAYCHARATVETITPKTSTAARLLAAQ